VSEKLVTLGRASEPISGFGLRFQLPVYKAIWPAELSLQSQIVSVIDYRGKTV
jgi:hypothetical protein